MNTHDWLPLVWFLTPAFALMVWFILRGWRWEKNQQEAINRGKLARETAAKNYEDAMSVSRAQLQALEELLAEIKALREDFNKK
jgi:hypothetical protein